MTTGKTMALTRWTFVGKVMSLLLNMLSRLAKGKARAELRPARRQSRLPHSRSLLLPGREG